MARLYANENFPLPTVEALRRFGHDVLTTADSARAGQAIPDAEVLALIAGEDMVIVDAGTEGVTITALDSLDTTRTVGSVASTWNTSDFSSPFCQVPSAR